MSLKSIQSQPFFTTELALFLKTSNSNLNVINWVRSLFRGRPKSSIGDHMRKRMGGIIVFSSALIFLQGLGGLGLWTSNATEEKGPEVILRDIGFLLKKVSSTPSPVEILEIHIEVLNKSRQATAPAGSIKLVLIPKETKYPKGAPGTELALDEQETMIAVPLAPGTGRIMTFGFSLPGKAPESMTFEIQLNPPEGEKKTATWQRSR